MAINRRYENTARPGLGQELIHVALGDSMAASYAFAWIAHSARMVLGDQVDTGVTAPSARPATLPQPHAAKFMLVDRVVGEEPLTDVLELLASDPGSGSKRANRSLNVATMGMLTENYDVQIGLTLPLLARCAVMAAPQRHERSSAKRVGRSSQ